MGRAGDGSPGESARPDLERLLDFASSVPGYFPRDRLAALASFAESGLDRVAGNAVEFGSYCGRSTVVLGAICRARQRRLVTVDHHLGSIEMHPPFPYFDPAMIDRTHGRLDSLGPLMDTLELAGLRDHVSVLVTRSAKAGEILAPGFAFALIDGGHDDLTAHQDLISALRLLGAGGTLVIDDVFSDPSQGGQAPYRMMVAALHSGFEPVGEAGPLVALRRSG